MSQCPECKNVLQLPDNTQRSLEAYGGYPVVKTSCCGKLVRARREIRFYADVYEGQATEDDWGRPR